MLTSVESGRHLTIDTPIFWSTVYGDSRTQVELLALFLRRTASQPLNISLADIRTGMDEFAANRNADILRSALPYFSRCKSLSIRIANIYNSVLPLLSYCEGRFDWLESLTIAVASPLSWNLTSASRLRHLSLGGPSCELHGVGMPQFALHQLTRVRLEAADMDTMLGIILGCSNLIELQCVILKRALEDTTVGVPVTSSSLRAYHAQFYDIFEIPQSLEYLTLPNLTCLRYFDQFPDSPEDLLAFLERSRCALNTLELSVPRATWSSAEWIRIMRQTPAVSSLKIDGSASPFLHADVIKSLLPPESEHCHDRDLLPNLKNLVCDNTVIDFPFVRMIEGRWRGPGAQDPKAHHPSTVRLESLHVQSVLQADQGALDTLRSLMSEGLAVLVDGYFTSARSEDTPRKFPAWGTFNTWDSAA